MKNIQGHELPNTNAIKFMTTIWGRKGTLRGIGRQKYLSRRFATSYDSWPILFLEADK